MVGLQTDIVMLFDSAEVIGAVVLAMLISRLIVVFGLVSLLSRIPGSQAIGLKFQQVMYWGGLRGAIALAIVLSLPDSPLRERLITVVMGAVLFTLVVLRLQRDVSAPVTEHGAEADLNPPTTPGFLPVYR